VFLLLVYVLCSFVSWLPAETSTTIPRKLSTILNFKLDWTSSRTNIHLVYTVSSAICSKEIRIQDLHLQNWQNPSQQIWKTFNPLWIFPLWKIQLRLQLTDNLNFNQHQVQEFSTHSQTPATPRECKLL
jgi:hypothetical protein